MTRCPVTRESVPRPRRMLFGEVDVSAVIKHVPSCLSTVRRPSCRMSADRPRDARSDCVPANATNHVAPREASVTLVAQNDAGGCPRRNNALNCRNECDVPMFDLWLTGSWRGAVLESEQAPMAAASNRPDQPGRPAPESMTFTPLDRKST